MAQLILQAENPSILEHLKSVLSLMRGVRIIATDTSVKVRNTALDDVPNTTTLAAMKEVESGHDAGVVRVDSLGDFIASMEE